MIEWSNLIFHYSTWVYFKNYSVENKNNLCEKIKKCSKYDINNIDLNIYNILNQSQSLLQSSITFIIYFL